MRTNTQKRSLASAIVLALCPIIFDSNPAGAQALAGKRAPSQIIATAPDDQWRTVNPAKLVVMELSRGRVIIELSDRLAPNHVGQMQNLVKGGFYDGLSFYRVIEGFVAQGGDPFEERVVPDGVKENLVAEIEHLLMEDEADVDSVLPGFANAGDGYAQTATGWLDGIPIGVEWTNSIYRRWPLHCTGAFAFGRNNDPDSASTEFYITLQPQRYLDRNLTIFGRVIDGMDHIQALTRQLPPEDETDPLGDEIRRVWMGDAPPEGETTPVWQVFRTDNALFADYVESRRNRPEAFFFYRPNHVDVCQVTIPVRMASPANNTVSAKPNE